MVATAASVRAYLDTALSSRGSSVFDDDDDVLYCIGGRGRPTVVGHRPQGGKGPQACRGDKREHLLFMYMHVKVAYLHAYLPSFHV